VLASIEVEEGMKAQESFNLGYKRPWRLIAAIVLSTLLLVGIVSLTSLQRKHISEVHTASLEAGEAALLGLQDMRSKLDAMIVGDRPVDPAYIQKFLKGIDANLLHIQTLATQGQNFIGRHRSTSDLHLKVELARKMLAHLAVLTNKRMARINPGSVKPNSYHDPDVDASYRSLRQAIERVNTQLDSERREEVHTAGILQMTSITLILLSGVFITLVVLRYDAQRQRDFKAALEARESLMREEKRFRDVFELLPVALWEKDFSPVKQRVDALVRRGVTDIEAYLLAHPKEVVHCSGLVRVLDVNPAAVSMYGASSREELIASHKQTLSEDANEDFVRALMALLHGEVTFEQQTQRRMLDGTLRDFILNQLVESDAKDWSHVLVAMTDVTKLKEVEREKQENQANLLHVQRLESLGVLAGGIAHDFNNLLTVITGNTGLARKCLPETSQALEYIGRTETASRRAADLCQQMLAYSGKGKFVVEPTNMSELVGEMADLLHVSIGKGVELRTRLATGLPPVDADVAQLQQVVINLVTNASDAIGEASGIITIATGVVDANAVTFHELNSSPKITAEQYVYLEVSDTGCGMDDETRQRLFEPFFTTKFTGRGLGMAAVLGIVRGHHGDIHIYSEPGKGSSFKVMLPCSDAQWAVTTAKKDEATKPAWRGEGVVLVVDDEEAIRELAALTLEDAGFKVLQAGNGIEGVETFRLHHDEIVVVLLDMTMPQMNGEDAMKEMRRIDPEAKIILSSGFNVQDTMDFSVGQKSTDFIQKPYQSHKLIEKLAEMLGDTGQA